MSKPNPEVFAKQVLWALAGIQAQLVEVEAHLVTHAAHADPNKIERLTAESAERRLARQKEIYEHLRKSVGIDVSPSDEPPAPRR
jgi:hypothetical protein